MTNLNDFCLVVPTIRNLENIKVIDENVKIIVIDDSDGKVKPLKTHNMEVIRYKDQKDFFKRYIGFGYKEYFNIIPHKSPSCRTFGFLLAYEYGYEKIVALDDDCVAGNDFFESHDVVGKKIRMQAVNSASGWFNPIDIMELDKNEKVYSRGYPYYLRKRYTIKTIPVEGRVILNMGLWKGVLDINGIDRFFLQDKEPRGISLKKRRCTLKNTVIPISTMNISFIREIVPAFYQLPMNHRITPFFNIDRFDDVWSGYIIQKIAKIKKDLITFGVPLVEHRKCGNLKKEVSVEHMGILMQPFFYNIIDRAINMISQKNETYYNLYSQLIERGRNLLDITTMPHCYKSYFIHMFNCMKKWLDVCEKIGVE